MNKLLGITKQRSHVWRSGSASRRVGAAGVCMSDEWVVHLRFGTEAPAGWSSLDVGGGFEVHYLLTPRG